MAVSRCAPARRQLGFPNLTSLRRHQSLVHAQSCTLSVSVQIGAGRGYFWKWGGLPACRFTGHPCLVFPIVLASRAARCRPNRQAGMPAPLCLQFHCATKEASYTHTGAGESWNKRSIPMPRYAYASAPVQLLPQPAVQARQWIPVRIERPSHSSGPMSQR